MAKAARFWKEFIGTKPIKASDRYHEWRIQELNFGLVLNDFDDKWTGANCVPVFEFADDEVLAWVNKAKSLGAKVILEALDNPELLSVIMSDPWGNEFELSKFH